MSLSPEFSRSAAKTPSNRAKPRPAPFSLRLSMADRERLLDEAGDVPLGTYIKEKLLGEPKTPRRSGIRLEDKAALAQVLALLGRSHIANNLNQLAKAVNTGSLPLTPETEAELLEAIRDVRAMRTQLMAALGLKPETT